jgi:hypothetical protein
MSKLLSLGESVYLMMMSRESPERIGYNKFAKPEKPL